MDIESIQIEQSRARDQSGDYRLIKDGKIPIEDGTSDLTLSCIVLLECPTIESLNESVAELARVTKVDGKILVVVNSEDTYKNNWASFECDFPENQLLKSGEKAKAIVRGTEIVFYDYYWSASDFRNAFNKAGLEVVSNSEPRAEGNESFEWVSEKEKAIWSIYLLNKVR